MTDTTLHDQFRTPEGWQWGHFESAPGRRLRYGWCVAPSARGVVLVLPGMGDFAEKYFKFTRDMLARGLSVVTLDWFDQGGSGRILPDTTRRHSEGFENDLADIGVFAKDILPGLAGGLPVIMFGHSMGGHLGMRFLLRAPALFKAAVFSAPMVRIQAVSFLSDGGWLPLTSMMAQHYARSFVPGGHEWSAKDRAFPGHNVFSSDPVRDTVHSWWCARESVLRVGSVTWGWIHHALQSCIALDREADTPPSVPVLFAAAGKDVFVSSDAIRRMAGRWQTARLLDMPSAKHEIVMETDDIRNRFLQAFDDVVDSALKGN